MSRPTSLRDFAPSILLIVVSALWLGGLSLTPKAGAAQVAAVFPPDWNRDQAFARVNAADALYVREGAWPFITVAASAEGAADPGLARRLRDAGAWFVIDPKALGSCLTQPVVGRP